jgi:hypothetical protein
MTRAEMEKKYPGLYARLGTVPDAEIAEAHGISAPRVCHFRQEHGIPAAGQRRLPSEEEWARLLALKGEVVVGADRRSVTVGGNTVKGRTLRQAVLLALRGAG